MLSKENSTVARENSLLTVAITTFCIVCFVAVARELDVRTSQELDFPLITASKNHFTEIHISLPKPLDSLSVPLLVSLSKLTSTGSGLFSFLDGGFTQIFGQIVSIIVKTPRNTNLVASRCFKMKKTSLPFDVRRSKTPFLKLPILSWFHLLLCRCICQFQ